MGNYAYLKKLKQMAIYPLPLLIFCQRDLLPFQKWRATYERDTIFAVKSQFSG